MTVPRIVNRYNGPRSEPFYPAGRLPITTTAANRGWQGDLDDARGLASSARKKNDPKEQITFSMMAIDKYSSAIEKMAIYNASQAMPDSGVTKEIKRAQSEMAALKTQMGIMSD